MLGDATSPSKIDYSLWLKEVAQSNIKYSPLFVGGQTFPSIFFFGNPESAVAATVGVNPSAKEFSSNRKWSDEYIEPNRLLERCRSYFQEPFGVQSHNWFEVWKDFLMKIGLSYNVEPKAVHFDLSLGQHVQ